MGFTKLKIKVKQGYVPFWKLWGKQFFCSKLWQNSVAWGCRTESPTSLMVTIPASSWCSHPFPPGMLPPSLSAPVVFRFFLQFLKINHPSSTSSFWPTLMSPCSANHYKVWCEYIRLTLIIQSNIIISMSLSFISPFAHLVQSIFCNDLNYWQKISKPADWELMLFGSILIIKVPLFLWN
jgi:hypothetical protein